MYWERKAPQKKGINISVQFLFLKSWPHIWTSYSWEKIYGSSDYFLRYRPFWVFRPAFYFAKCECEFQLFPQIFSRILTKTYAKQQYIVTNVSLNLFSFILTSLVLKQLVLRLIEHFL